MKKMKRLLAVLLTLVMVLGMTIMTFADIQDGSDRSAPAENTAARTYLGSMPQPTDTTQAAVANVASGAAVTAYRIVEPTYSSSGFTGYQAVSGTGIANAVEPTSDEVTSIAANKYLLNTLTRESLYADGWVDENGLTTYTAQLGAGYWLVIVTPLTGDVTEIYNPMLIGVYYSTDGMGDGVTLVSGGAVNATSNWSLNSTPAYAKSEKPTIDKRILYSDGNENGNDVAVGDTVSFEIEAQIPAYSKAYENVRVEISDQLGKGLTLASPAGIVVRVGAVSSQAIEVSGAAFTYMQYDNKSFRIAFNSEFALAHSGEHIYVTYDARLFGWDAGYNFDANTNTATLEYTNDAHDVNRTTRVEDKTYTYTFGIDTSLYGDSWYEWNRVTSELIKVGELDLAQAVSGSAVTAGAISGAVFTLTSTGSAIGMPASYTAISDADGRLKFTGLDAGTYILQETIAPEGYSLNYTEIPVVISAWYNEDGTLNSYTITVNNEVTSVYTGIYQTYQINDTTKVTEITNISSSAITYAIKNTRLSGLPSTGGIGTTIFTIAGCVIMILAAALFFANRRKSAK